MTVPQFVRGSQASVGVASAGIAVLAATLIIARLELVQPGPLAWLLAGLLGGAGGLVLWLVHRLSKIRELNLLQQAVIDSSPNAVVTSDNEGRIVAVNPAAERLFGSLSQLARHRMSDLIAAPELGADAGPIRGNVLDRLGCKIVGTGHHVDGSSFPIEMAVLHVGSGHRALFAAYIRDLTEQQKVAAALRAQQDRMHQNEKLTAMGSLLAGVAHELNNPLAILVTQATLLKEKAPTPDVERRAERIHAAAHRAGRIVKNFLAMTRQKSPVPVPIEINPVIEAAIELVAYGLRSTGVEVRLSLAPDLPLVNADRDLLAQVVAAMAINAQQALAEMGGPRRIEVTSSVRDGDVAVELTDNGCGFDPAIREQIFEPYFTTKPAGAGTGIGLSVCQNIMRLHGGRIDAISDPGHGATFRIALPALAPAAPVTAQAAQDGMTVLVVDDEIEVAESLAELLDVFGHRAVVISSPTEAIERLQRNSFDLVITDLRMPGMSGTALHRAIKAFDARLARRTVIMTGDTVTGPSQGAQGVLDGEALVLEKPFTAESLRAVLDRAQAR